MSKVRAEQYTNRAGSGAPEIPYGVTVPSGASIDGAGGLNLTGIATAGTFKGNLTGDVSGNVTGVAATFTGPVTIGGTLTYEDVTNIDAVGIITARDGIKVTGGNLNVGTAITAYGSTGIISATSYRGDGSQLSGIDAAPTVTGTVSGSIGANKGVIVKSDGNFEQVAGATVGTGGAEHWYSNASYYPSDIRCAATPNGNTVAIIYQIWDNATNYSFIRVGTTTQNESDTTVSWGTAEQFGEPNSQISNTPADHGIVNVDNNRFLLFWFRSGDMEGRLMSVSGTTITYGSIIAIGAQTNQGDCCLMGAGSNKVFLAGRTTANVEYGKVLDCGSSGLTITLGTSSTPSWSIEYPQVCWDPVHSQAIVALKQGGDCKSVIYEVSGTTITSTSNLLSTGGGMGSSKPAIAFDTNVNRAIIVMKSSNGNTWIFNGVPTSGGITWYSPGSSGSGSYNTALALRSNRLAYDPITKKTSWIFTKESGNFSTWTSYITINTTENAPYWTLMTEIQTANAGADQDLDCCIVPSTLGGLTMWAFTRSNASPKTGAIKFQQISSSNMTTGNFIGFSDAAYTNGQTAKVKVVGNVTTQSGLTPGQKYYVQFDAGVGTTEQDPSIVAGRALSSTSLLIQSA